MAPKYDQLQVKPTMLQNLGSIIVSDIAQLEVQVQSFWQQPEVKRNDQGEAEPLLSNLPACLQADFQGYQQQQQAALAELLRQRKRTGELLSQAASLADFKERVSQDTSLDLYKVNTCYQGTCVPEHLQSPNDGKRTINQS